MRPVFITFTGTGPTAPVRLDTYQTPFSVGIGVLVAGTGWTFNVQHTQDDVYAVPAPANYTWFNNPTSGLGTGTASIDGNYAYPVGAVRLNVTAAGTGTGTFVVRQAGAGR